MKKICFIDQIGSHYREPIYSLLAQDLKCDFFFGDYKSSVKSIDNSKFAGFKKSLRRTQIGPLYSLKDAWKSVREYDTIITSGDLHALYVWKILIMGFFCRKEVCLWTHGWYGKETFFRRILKRVMFSFARKIFLYGNHARNLMIKEGFPPEKLVVVSNSLNYDAQTALRKTLKKDGMFKARFGNDNPVLLYIGRIQKIKKLDMLLELVLRLKNSGNPANLVIVGDDAENVNLPKLAEDMGISQSIWFYGSCYDERKNAEIVFNADLGISPGNVGLMAIHCLTFGCPVITHDNFALQMPEFE
ncbi:MAG: glycosyltransferase, partial [Opitutales bacterium]|nr:glycosyltransferase [Opitutales bacterium]